MHATGAARVPCVWKFPKEGVSCVMQTERGELYIEGVGECPVVEAGHCPVVLYQKGLIPLDTPERSHRNLISTFNIGNGKARANVPWFNIAWSPPVDSPIGLVRECRCTTPRDTCEECLGMVEVNNVFVVWHHSFNGERVYQWYTYFSGLKRLLTPLPPSCIQRVLKNAKKGTCHCGRCPHPVKSMINSRSKRSIPAFENQAIRLFRKYRELVEDVIDAEKTSDCKQVGSIPPSWNRESVEFGTCAVCLDDTFVADGLCVQGKCKTALCIDCHKRMRGMCPICDRQKLGSGISFYCYACDGEHSLETFGLPCVKCGDACLCTTCNSAYRVCTSCETDMLTDAPKKQKTA
mgnify:CR=1 FL=1